MDSAPGVGNARPRTPLEERLEFVRRVTFGLFVLSLIGFVLYAGVTYVIPLLSGSDVAHLVAMVQDDPICYAFTFAMGVCLTLSMLALIPSTLLTSDDEVRSGFVVISGSIAIEFC